jgi:hypothetical protein
MATLFMAGGSAYAASAPIATPHLTYDYHYDNDHDHDHHWHHHSHARVDHRDFDDYFASTDRDSATSKLKRYFGKDADLGSVQSYPSTYTNCENEPGPGKSKWACSKKPFTVSPEQQELQSK